ncbi:MAG TPA: putative sporulation protein YtxC, partial [Defluviitaleaceae bacterium]|nr:putative sporulation protein YtxC [Defluviitaleaceae bacterium]
SDGLEYYVSSAITNVILKYTRFDIITEILETKYSRYLSFENGKILDIIKDFFYEHENNDSPQIFNYSYRKEIMNSLLDFFEDNNEFIYEGFVQFRMKKYREVLERALDFIVKEYETQKEYKEFLRLLKYFVDVQEMKEELVHIIGIKNGQFKLFDKDKKDITNRCKEEFMQDSNNKDINYDDFLVSALITIAPKQIIIHNYQELENRPIFETIINIFQGKVSICQECDFCIDSIER